MKEGLPENLCFVFSKISQPGNLGFVARLMGNFGNKNLRLVQCCDHLADEALRYSTHSAVLLKEAKVFPDLPSALADCEWVVGTTARKRRSFFPLYSLPAISQLLESCSFSFLENPKKEKNRKEPSNREKIQPQVAFLFGNETSGLSNLELSFCQAYLTIPTAPLHSSLNLSHAFALVIFQLFQHFASPPLIEEQKKNKIYDLALVGEVEGLKDHFFTLLEAIGFLHQTKEMSLRENISAFFAHSQVSKKEVRILRAIVNKTLVAIKRLSSQREGLEKEAEKAGKSS